MQAVEAVEFESIERNRARRDAHDVRLVRERGKAFCTVTVDVAHARKSCLVPIAVHAVIRRAPGRFTNARTFDGPAQVADAMDDADVDICSASV